MDCREPTPPSANRSSRPVVVSRATPVSDAQPSDSAGDTLAAPTMWAATGFDQPGAGSASSKAQPTSPFDVCQVGVVLRVVLGMQLVIGLGVAHLASGPANWLVRWSQASAVALPASLLWLVLACSGRRLLDRLSPTGQWISGGTGRHCGLVRRAAIVFA